MQLQKGLDIYFEREIKGIHSLWLCIEQIQGAYIHGFIEYVNVQATIHRSEILRVLGTLEWNIANLNVSCSKKLLEEKKIGYFINRMSEKPGHFGRVFYAASEIYSIKAHIDLVEVPLYVIVAMDRNILPFLEDSCYYGCIRKEDAYTILSEHDILNLDRAIFPSSIEIDE